MQLHQKIGCESGGRLGVKGTGSNIVFQKKKVCKSGQKNEQHREFFFKDEKTGTASTKLKVMIH